MTRRSSTRGLKGWVIHRLTNNYWSLPILAVLAAALISVSAIFLDRAGATDWLLGHDLAPVAAADTARDVAGVAVGVDTALLVLYCSISLLVLTIAASNLGVRLIDRWLEKPLVRLTLSSLAFSVIYGFVQMAAIDSDAPLSETPLLGFAGLLALQVFDIGLLAVALHDLGRTMFVDRSIAYLGHEAMRAPLALVARPREPQQWPVAEIARAPCEGYVETCDMAQLAHILRAHPGRIRILTAPGAYVLPGEPMMVFEHAGAPLKELVQQMAVGKWRSNAQGVVFEIRLLVELAARALSPAINDFYTALTCADRLALTMVGQAPTWIDAQAVALWREEPRFELPGRDFVALFANPLAAFRQAACDYPSVALRMIDNYARLIDLAKNAGLREFHFEQARALAAHAASRATFAGDREALDAALERVARVCEQVPADE